VATLKDATPVLRLAELIGADAFAVHLNPLQELLQVEGSPRFRGVLAGIALLVRQLPVPVIVKEIGAGLSADVVRSLLDAGVRHVDVAGAGGTSWAGVEILRRSNRGSAGLFWDWGIPTAEAVRNAAAVRRHGTPFTLIASGGMTSGLDAAKCLAFGADLVASARPMLKVLVAGKKPALRRLMEAWSWELRSTMFLTGCRTIADLGHAHMIERPEGI
jgi:isopentenyl-diphosphate delta-isomerase